MRLVCLIVCSCLAGLTLLNGSEESLVGKIDALTSRLHERPSDLGALVELTQIYEQVGADERAIPLAERALEIDPDLVETRLILARMVNHDGLTVEAEDVLRKGLNRTPENLALRLALAESQLAVRYAAGAAETLSNGFLWHETDPRLRLLLGQTRVMTGDVELALTDLAAAASLPIKVGGIPDDKATREIHARASFTLALLALRRGDDDALAQHLDHCLQNDPRHREALLMAAELKTEMGDLEGAVTHLTALLRFPINQRPAENEILRSLPYPDGLHAWAMALANTGNADAGVALLMRSAEAARKRGQVALVETIESWSEGLKPSAESIHRK